jgi:hypothetical protein
MWMEISPSFHIDFPQIIGVFAKDRYVLTTPRENNRHPLPSQFKDARSMCIDFELLDDGEHVTLFHRWKETSNPSLIVAQAIILNDLVAHKPPRFKSVRVY